MSNGNLVTNTPVVYISVRDCPFTWKGQNLAAMRRAEIRPLAKGVKVSADGSKQEILKRLLGKLQAMDAPKELSEI